MFTAVVRPIDPYSNALPAIPIAFNAEPTPAPVAIADTLNAIPSNKSSVQNLAVPILSASDSV